MGVVTNPGNYYCINQKPQPSIAGVRSLPSSFYLQLSSILSSMESEYSTSSVIKYWRGDTVVGIGSLSLSEVKKSCHHRRKGGAEAEECSRFVWPLLSVHKSCSRRSWCFLSLQGKVSPESWFSSCEYCVFSGRYWKLLWNIIPFFASICT